MAKEFYRFHTTGVLEFEGGNVHRVYNVCNREFRFVESVHDFEKDIARAVDLRREIHGRPDSVVPMCVSCNKRGPTIIARGEPV